MLGHYFKKKLERELRLHAAKGYPTTLADLNAWPAAPGESHFIPTSFTESLVLLRNLNETHEREGNEQSLDEMSKAEFLDHLEKISEETDTLLEEHERASKLFAAGRDEEAIELLTRGRKEREPLILLEDIEGLPRKESLSDDQRGTLDEFVTPRCEILKALKGEELNTASRFRVQWENEEHSGDLVHASHEAVKLLCAHAVLEEDRDHVDSAVHSLVAAARVLKVVQSIPLLITALVVCLAIHRIVVCLERMITRTRLNKQQIIEIRRAITPLDDEGWLTRVFAGEMCFGLQGADTRKINDYLDYWFVSGPIYKSIAWSYLATGWRWADTLRFTRGRIEEVSAASKPLPRRLDELDVLVKKHQEIPFYYPSSRIALPMGGKLGDLDAVHLARIRAALMALDVEDHRREKGMLPNSITQFASNLPRDPFAETNLNYTKTDGGYAVYSIGPNRTDNGGSTEKDPTFRPYPNDIVFSVEQ